MAKFKAALFDLDGVVFDTEPQYTDFWRSQCELYHPEMPGLEYKIKGQTLVEIYDNYFSGSLIAEQPLITSRLNEFEERMSFDYVSGFEVFVSDLKKNGVKTAVVTSSNVAKMKSVYAKHPDFKSLFDIVLTSEDFEYSKPAPDCYLKASERLNVGIDECIVFEDSFNGLKSGRAAEMFVVGLATTNSTEAITPLCDFVMADYTDTDYKKLNSLLA